MGRVYSNELDDIPNTIEWASQVPLHEKSSATRSGSGSSIFVVLGSGGSFTVAHAIATNYTLKKIGIGIAWTPMQYALRGKNLPSHRVLLVSAEGKNSDILLAARCSLDWATGVETLTFSETSPLLSLLAGKAVTTALQAPWGKDGYLATNSLIAALLVAFRLQGSESLDPLLLRAWFKASRTSFLLSQAGEQIAAARKVLVLYGNQGQTGAVDIESKISEAGFGFAQITDFRQFAHGRHIQLVDQQSPFPVLSFVSPAETELWAATRRLIPEYVPVTECQLPESFEMASICGVLNGMIMMESASKVLHQDPGSPVVPEFARRIHFINPRQYFSHDGSRYNRKVASLEPALGCDGAKQAGASFIERLRLTRFRAVVMDFDGTLCETTKRKDGLDPSLKPLLLTLLDHGIVLAFASGRGRSIYNDLRKKIPEKYWDKVILGMYSGSVVLFLSENYPEVETVDQRIAAAQNELESLGLTGNGRISLSPRFGQLTVRESQAQSTELIAELCELVAEKIGGLRTYRSAHSVDLVSDGTSKLAVVEALRLKFGIDDPDAVLRLGDRGERSGNDYELLGDGLGLSVDGVSDDPLHCWLLGDPKLSPVQRCAHLLQALEVNVEQACFSEAALDHWLSLITQEV
jgi:hydroxymethylpyrimidine pyrophosphatase-like HAD family hydrolase/fructoselysine-6-P-deglycase FrlB-like protein